MSYLSQIELRTDTRIPHSASTFNLSLPQFNETLEDMRHDIDFQVTTPIDSNDVQSEIKQAEVSSLNPNPKDTNKKTLPFFEKIKKAKKVEKTSDEVDPTLVGIQNSLETHYVSES